MRSRLDEEDNAAPEAYCGSTKTNKLVIRKYFYFKLGQYSLVLPKLSSFMLLLNTFLAVFKSQMCQSNLVEKNNFCIADRTFVLVLF